MSKNISAYNSERTLGDGMDCSLITLPDNASKLLEGRIKVKLSKQIPCTFRPILPKGPIVSLVPKYIPSNKKQTKYLTAKPKDPKFIPYEPYKAAVDPIIPKVKHIPKNIVKTKNNIDIQDLVLQIAEMRTLDMDQAKHQALESDEPLIPKTKWEEEKIAYENDIKNLRETNAHLENQLKFQAQVNSELKTLLVAAVGEDLETRVQHLTEAKLLLAKELLNSAYNLTSHQEQTEWLSGQCEVWRSKFLASSLMVEELAKWKSALTIKINELQDVIKELLEERVNIRSNLIDTYLYLQHIKAELSNGNEEKLIDKTDILHLSKQVMTLSEQVLKTTCKSRKPSRSDVFKLPMNTKAENAAIKALTAQVHLSTKPDMICNAVMGAAFSCGSNQMYLQHPSLHATCCAHCKGEVQDI